MQGFKPTDSLYQDFPDVLLLHECARILVFTYFLEHVSIIRIVHHDTTSLINLPSLPEGGARLIEKCLFVGDNIFVFDRGKYPDLVERILFLSVGEIKHLDLFESVFLPVFYTSNFVNATVRTVTYDKLLITLP